ncbi:MAG: hypothetical protein ABEJ22_04420 [Haloferacaceae archaeon]
MDAPDPTADPSADAARDANPDSAPGTGRGTNRNSAPDTGRGTNPDPAVSLPASILDRYRRFTLYNSPYPAHDYGHAVDLYPDDERGISPVAGVVSDVRTVAAPQQPYAVDHDHLVVLDVDGDWARAAGYDDWAAARGHDGGLVARVLHVDPAVEPGDRVAVGDSLGRMVRSGFFARWVDNHVHLGFRRADQNPVRASGSLRLAADVAVEALPWDGTGTVVETGETYAVLDAPAHPAPGERFVAVADDDGRPLDGGLPHYERGGVLSSGRDGVLSTGRDGVSSRGRESIGPEVVSLLGTRVGVADGRDVAWDDVTVVASGVPVTGLSLFVARDGGFGAKLVCPDHEFERGERVEVRIERGNEV